MAGSCQLSGEVGEVGVGGDLGYASADLRPVLCSLRYRSAFEALVLPMLPEPLSSPTVGLRFSSFAR